MLRLDIHVQSCSRIFEVLPEEVENAELMVEDAASHGLLTLFDEVNVDDVTVCFSSASHMGQRDCSIKIQAQCSYQSFALLPRTQEYMELAVGRCMCSLLKELFGPVTIDSIAVQTFFMADVQYKP